MGLKTNRELTQSVPAAVDAAGRAATRREAEGERSGISGLDTAARTILRSRRRCQPVPRAEAIRGDARP